MKHSITLLLFFLVFSCDSSTGNAPRESNTIETLKNSADSSSESFAVSEPVTIRWTKYGVPHIEASNFKDLGFGSGWAFASKNICVLADQIIRVRSERSRFFGPGKDDKNIKTDFGYKALEVLEDARKSYPKMSQNAQDLLNGYAKGFNSYFLKKGIENLPRPCKNQRWVKEISPEDLLAYYMVTARLASGDFLMEEIVEATPPVIILDSNRNEDKKNEDKKLPLKNFSHFDLGSNAWAIGKKYSSNGRGMVLGNPHLPLHGALQFFEFQVKIPGVYNVAGASLFGFPIINIGFNKNLAWTHTTSTSRHLSLYELDLKKNNVFRYRYDNDFKEIKAKKFFIEVLQKNGELKTKTRTLYYSHYGPIIESWPLTWGRKKAYTMKDANKSNYQMIDQWIEMGQSKNMDDFKETFKRYNGIPWANVFAADRYGSSFYMDGTPVPKFSKKALDSWKKNVFYQLVYSLADVHLFNGSKSTNEWLGLVPYEEAPKLERDDFVANSNDSHWIINPSAKLEGFSPLYGRERTVQNLRTRASIKMIEEAIEDDGKLSLNEMEEKLMSFRSFRYELIGEDLKERCKKQKSFAAYTKKEVTREDLERACEVFVQWDGRFKIDRRGAHLFREWMSRFEDKHYQVEFDPKDPVNTPRELKERPLVGFDFAFLRLSKALADLKEANIPVDELLGNIQFLEKDKLKIPMPGGDTPNGVFNLMTANQGYFGHRTLFDYPEIERKVLINEKTSLSKDGYSLKLGSSWVMLVQFSEDDVEARGLMTYSNASNPDSSNFFDQSYYLSEGMLRKIPYSDEDIANDKNLIVEKINP